MDQTSTPGNYHAVIEKFGDLLSAKTVAQAIKQKLRTEQPLITTEKRKQEILRSMLKARKDKCCIKVRYGKVLFCGAGAAGKTNFLNLLMKKDFEQKHKSTELVKPQQVTIAMKALVSSNHNEIAFTTMDIDEEIHQLMSYLPKKYTEQTLPHHADPQHTVQEDVSQNSYTTAEDIMSEKLASDSELTKQVAKHEWNILTFMDTGGQPQFISMLPTVNSFAMITFIVHKMAKGEKSLDNNVMVQHGNQQGENSFPPHSYECTYLQLIKTLMTYASSVLFPDVQFLQEVGCKNTKNTNSNISIIGTHSADVSADDIKKIDKALADMIDNAGCKNVKPNLNEEYEYLIPVDNKDQINRNKSDSDTVIDIKKYTNPSIICKHIYDFQMQQDVYSVPIQWLLLELEIRKVCIDKECCFITYKDVLNLATKKNLGDEDFIKNGLRFHHLFGVLLYFENVEGMCELIITNHQWLFDKLTEIVHYSFKCATKGDRDELRIGIFKDAMLEELKIEKDFKNANIDTQLINPKKAFLNLLKHLKIVVPLNEDETKYFMPSILKSHPLTDAELEKAIPGKNSFKHQSNENAEAEPFLFQLESTSVNLIPRGFFCFLIVELICSTGWRPYKKNLYDNLVTFFKVEGGYFVTIIDKIFFLEVRITHENGNVIPIHYGVLKIMHNTMVEVEKNLCIRCIIKHGFLCKKCSDTEQQHLTYLHMTHVDEDGIKYVSPSDSMGCDCINERLTSIESSHQIWLQKNKNLQGITPQKQNMNGSRSFDYSTVKQNLTAKYAELSHLPYESMKNLLYSKKVITTDQKQDIEIKKGRAKMEMLLDIIILSLKAENSIKYEGFLEAMEESEDIDLKEAANRLPKSLFYQMLQQAKNEDLTINTRYASITVCGASHSGKTSFIHLLQNKRHKAYYESIRVDNAKMLSKEKIYLQETDWIAMDSKLETQELVKRLIFKLQKQAGSDIGISTNDAQQHTTSVEEEMATFSTSVNQPSLENLPDTWDTFTLLDTVGIPELINMMPAINTCADITFIVLDISNGKECLSTPITAQYQSEGYNYSKHNLKYTKRYFLQCLLSSVKVAAMKKYFHSKIMKQVTEDKHPRPVVCIIGTHADVLKRNFGDRYDEVLHAINEEVRKLVEPIMRDNVLVIWRNEDGFVIPIDNDISTEQVKGFVENQSAMNIQRIREQCSEVLRKKAQYEIPISWFVLELELRNNDKVCIPLNEVKEICNKIMPAHRKMETDVITEVLKFYHLFGMLLYFNEVNGMNNFVITDPQWLFTNLTKVVMCKFEAHTNELYRSAHHIEQLHNGIVRMELFRRLRLELQGIGLEPLINLLLYLTIIAPLMDKSYFMPSILPMCYEKIVLTEEEYGKPAAFAADGKCIVSEVQPLLIEFSHGTIPRGLFGCLIVQLLQQHMFELYGKNDYTRHIFHRCTDLISLYVKPCYYVTIRDRILYLELQVRTKGNEPSNHYYMQSAVTKALQKVCDYFNWQFNECRYGFLCNQHAEYFQREHLTLLSSNQPIPNEIPKYTYCYSQQTMQLKKEHIIWFKDVQEVSKINDDNKEGGNNF